MEMHEIAVEMLTERTAHSIIDSGDHYGRAYQRNQKTDFTKHAQATLVTRGYGIEVSVSFYHHMQAVLEEDVVCEAFNKLPCEAWDGDYSGCSKQMSDFLDRIGAEVEDGWNSYNWDNRFDQVVQGHRVEINQEEYTLLQIHGGCDVRSGYTDAKLFKIQTWQNDYWLFDDCSFGLPRAAAEAAGYPKIENPEYDEVSLNLRGPDIEIYDHCSEDQEQGEFDPDKLPDGLELVGTQDAVEH